MKTINSTLKILAIIFTLISTAKTNVNSAINTGDPYAKYYYGGGGFCPNEYKVPFPRELHHHNIAVTDHPNWNRYIDSLNSIGESVLLNW